MNLQLDVQMAFSEHGVLARVIEIFNARNGQVEMALAVAKAIEDSEVLVVEASTGVGKTYAYLIPALLSGERILVSTATKTLQDQLFGRDLPRLITALGVPVRTAMLKGRASYICLHRLESAQQLSSATDLTKSSMLAQVERWAHFTKAGDLSELSGLDEHSTLIPLITSTRENCLGTQCPKFNACHVVLARREAMAADVVVINHHLFFADLAIRESGVAEILPSVNVVIFDEAHQLNETGVQFSGENLTAAQLFDFCRDMLGAGLLHAKGLVDWQDLVGSCERSIRELTHCVGKVYSGTKLGWTAHSPNNVDSNAWKMALTTLHATFSWACTSLDHVRELASDFVRLHERVLNIVARLISFSVPCKAGSVRWLEVGTVGTQLRLIESPLNIAEIVKNKMIEIPGNTSKSWIFTSATLGTDEKLSWFTQPCGLENARILRVGSPFDYATQAALYIPENFPKPSDSSHSAIVANSSAKWAKKLAGRTMVLTTSLRALRAIGEALQLSFKNPNDIEVLVQGAMPKRVLIQRFSQGNANGQPGCILVASASFWEGIDVPGDALQLVVIDKLPFPPLNDPMAEARSKILEAEGRSAFNNYFYPEAAMALKQGAGRLIRRETDRGILVVCDTRIISMGYGKRMIKALPPMKRLNTEDEFEVQLQTLTKIYTKSFPSP